MEVAVQLSRRGQRRNAVEVDASTLEAMLGPRHGPEVLRAVGGAGDDAVVRAALRHLVEPTTNVTDLAARTEAPRSAVLAAYDLVRTDAVVDAYVRSNHYPWHKLHETAGSWATELGRREDAGLPLLPEIASTVEIHATKGTCGYRCTMCLWSDQESLTYSTSGFGHDDLMTVDDWRELLARLADNGCEVVVLSGGGEPLLHRQLADIAATITALGMRYDLYTTGFNLGPEDDDTFAALLDARSVRFSIHAASPQVYADLVGVPPARAPLARVRANLEHLLELRRERPTDVTVAIGFVLQESNVGELEAIVDLAFAIGVDRIDLRRDEVSVTPDLRSDVWDHVATVLDTLRDRADHGWYLGLEVDLADDLVAVANGSEPHLLRSEVCRVKHARPTVSPYGVYAPCDLKAEPRFAAPGYTIGDVRSDAWSALTSRITDGVIPADCTECMPNSRTTNAVLTKLLDDRNAGVGFDDQPFTSRK